MHELDSSFEKLLGRQPSEKERHNLYRVKNALGIHDNDALWLVLMSLESYDTLFSKLPDQIHQQVIVTVEEIKRAARLAAEAESQKALATLARAVSETSEKISKRALDNQRLIALSFYSASIVLFGSLCLVVGFILGSGRMPYWADYPQDASLPLKIISAVVQAPAGWLIPLAGACVCCVLLYRPLVERSSPSVTVIAFCALFTFVSALLLAPFFS